MTPPEEDKKEELEVPLEAPKEEYQEEAQPPKPEIRIVDFSEKKINPYCTVCGKKKERYLEIEVDGVVEYTCKECYTGSGQIVVITCKNCSSEMEQGDNFCSQCGAPAVIRCSSCNAEIEEEDKFCAKCGVKLFSTD